MDVKIEESWKEKLKKEFESENFKQLVKFIKSEYQNNKIYPPARDIFNAFNYCPFDKTRVVIIGQDPYHGPGQAHGLCFSVNKSVKPPPSLVNIFKEIHDDLGLPIPNHGNLEHWAQQGVLLLNATLTVQAGQAGSHQNKGWEVFTDSIIKILSDATENLVFLLWGAYAQRKGAVIDRNRHLVLESAHPSPFAVHRGFYGNKHFSKTNDYLLSRNLTPINWSTVG